MRFLRRLSAGFVPSSEDTHQQRRRSSIATITTDGVEQASGGVKRTSRFRRYSLTGGFNNHSNGTRSGTSDISSRGTSDGKRSIDPNTKVATASVVTNSTSNVAAAKKKGRTTKGSSTTTSSSPSASRKGTTAPQRIGIRVSPRKNSGHKKSNSNPLDNIQEMERIVKKSFILYHATTIANVANTTEGKLQTGITKQQTRNSALKQQQHSRNNRDDSSSSVDLEELVKPQTQQDVDRLVQCFHSSMIDFVSHEQEYHHKKQHRSASMSFVGSSSTKSLRRSPKASPKKMAETNQSVRARNNGASPNKQSKQQHHRSSSMGFTTTLIPHKSPVVETKQRQHRSVSMGFIPRSNSPAPSIASSSSEKRSRFGFLSPSRVFRKLKGNSSTSRLYGGSANSSLQSHSSSIFEQTLPLELPIKSGVVPPSSYTMKTKTRPTEITAKVQGDVLPFTPFIDGSSFVGSNVMQIDSDDDDDDSANGVKRNIRVSSHSKESCRDDSSFDSFGGRRFYTKDLSDDVPLYIQGPGVSTTSVEQSPCGHRKNDSLREDADKTSDQSFHLSQHVTKDTNVAHMYFDAFVDGISLSPALQPIPTANRSDVQDSREANNNLTFDTHIPKKTVNNAASAREYFVDDLAGVDLSHRKEYEDDNRDLYGYDTRVSDQPHVLDSPLRPKSVGGIRSNKAKSSMMVVNDFRKDFSDHHLNGSDDDSLTSFAETFDEQPIIAFENEDGRPKGLLRSSSGVSYTDSDSGAPRRAPMVQRRYSVEGRSSIGRESIYSNDESSWSEPEESLDDSLHNTKAKRIRAPRRPSAGVGPVVAQRAPRRLSAGFSAAMSGWQPTPVSPVKERGRQRRSSLTHVPIQMTIPPAFSYMSPRADSSRCLTSNKQDDLDAQSQHISDEYDKIIGDGECSGSGWK